MKFEGKFDAKLPVDSHGAHSNAHHHVDHVTGHAPSDAILVQDAQLLFGGDYKRSGVDLILSKDTQELVLHDYFKGEKRVALASPDGAHLSGDVITALTGHQQFAQADGSASVNKVIGHVTKLTGTATAIRNGVSIILNNGDNVEKGDVVQAGANSTLGMTFIDGTVFGLSSNARMVLNEMIYDPNGSNNSSLLSLVQGTISFVAGETAKHGDMKVETPVATMGIRGTAVLVEIDFEIPGQAGAPNASFRVLVEPDGTSGSYILFDKVTLTPIATVNQPGTQTNISNGIVNFLSGAPLSADAQRIITEVFSQRFTDNNLNPKSNTQHTDIGVPELVQGIKLADGSFVTPILIFANAVPTTTFSSSGTPISSDHIPGPPEAVVASASLIERPGTGNTAIDIAQGLVSFADPNPGDKPTVSITPQSYTYQHNGNAGLNGLQLADIAAVVVDLLVVPDPANNNNGTATWTYSVPDRAFDFLAAGEVLTITYIAKIQNNFIGNNEFSLRPFTITITGTNDVPVITTGPQIIVFEGGTSVPGGNLTPIPNLPTSGTLVFNDVDLTDTHTVATALTGASMSGPGDATLDRAALEALAPTPMTTFAHALSVLIAADSTGTGTGRINWTLADLPIYLADFIPDGETLTLTYTVTLKDSQNTVSTQTVIVTITGTDNPAVVWIATATEGSTAGGLWSNPVNWETGTVPKATDDVIIITDQLHGLTPAFPVTIDAPAVAHSVTMNDFSLGLLPPHLINQSLLTIGRSFSVSADAIVDNTSAGTIHVGGPMAFVGNSVLNNAGTIVLAEGGALLGQSHITNSGTLEISGGTLDVSVDIANFLASTNGIITIDSGATLTLTGATITGGTINDNGILNLTGDAELAQGTLFNTSHLNVSGSGSGNALTDETVTNTGGTITVESGATLNLAGVTISYGELDNASSILVSGSGNTLDHVTVDNSGSVEILTDGALTIAGGSVSGSGSIQIDQGALLEVDATVSASQTIAFDGDGSSTLQIDTASFGGQISGLGFTDRIDLQSFGYEIHAVTATYTSNASHTGGVLTIFHGNDTPIELTLVGDYTGAHFTGSADTDGSTLVTLDQNDTAPAFDAADTTQAGSFSELTAVTGSLAQDPIPSIGGTVHFTDVNLLDRPTAEIGTQTVTWTQGTTDLFSLMTPAQILALQHALSLTQSGNTNTGGIGWIYSITDSDLDFLGEGQTATVTSTITLNDGYEDATNTATVTVTIGGANDAPVVAAILANEDSASADRTESNVGLTADGTLTVTDVDITDQVTVSRDHVTVLRNGVLQSGSVGGLSNATLAGYLTLPGGAVDDATHTSGQFTWQFNSGSQAFDFLALGETLTLQYTIRPSDGHIPLGTGDAVVTITITGTNDAPVISGASNTVGYTEQSAAVAVDNAIVVSDVDTATLAGATATISAGFQSGDRLTINGATDGDIVSGSGTIHYHYDAATHAIELSGVDTLAHYQDALRLVSYGNASNDDPTAGGAAPSRTVTWVVNDGLDSSTTATTTINVTPVNDAPVLVLADVHTQVIDEDNSLVFNAAHGNAITLGDVDASGANETVNLSVAHGVLTLASLTGLTVTGNGTGAVGLTGTVAAINAALDGLSYAPTHDYNGTDQLTISADDLGHTGSGNLTATRHVAITINPVNDAPVGVNDAISNAAPPSGSGWVLDTDNGHYYRYVAAFVDWATAASTAASHGNYLATITSAAENAFVANLSGISGAPFGAWTGGYTTSANPFGTGPFFTDHAPYSWLAGPEAGALVSYTNWNPGQPNGGFFSNTAAIEMVAGGTWYDIPTGFAAGGYVEEWGGQQNQVAFREDTGATLTTAQLLANDTDVDSSHLTVTAVSAASAHGGTVSLNGNIITYHPAANYAGDDSFTYTVSDGSLTSTATVSFNVAPVADAPVLDANNVTVAEGANGVVTLFGIHVTDNDPGSVLSITATANHGSLAPNSIPGTTESAVNTQFSNGIVYTPTAPFNDAVSVNDTVTVNVTDNSGLTDTMHFVFQQSGPGGTALTGTVGKDIIFSTGGNDTLTGLAGSDNFVFAPHFGRDTVSDFTSGQDHIDLRALSATVDAANIGTWLAGHTSTSTTNPADTLITLDSANVITLHNVALGNLHVGDFIVSPHA